MARYTNTPKTSLKGINAELVKIQDAFEDVLDRKGDGANFLDTDLDMNSQRILNLPEPVYSQEPVRLGDVKPFIDDTKTARDAAVEAAGVAQESEEQAAVSAGQAASSAEQSATSAANSAAKAKDLTEITSALLISQGLSGEYGFFEKGFTYNSEGDVGIDSDGNIWTYNGALPFEVEKDTVPSEPAYSKYSLSKNYTQRVQNIDELKALEIDESMVGNRIKINEYHAGTGYGEGVWEVVEGTSPNDVDIIQSNTNTSIQFKKVITSSVNVLSIGADKTGVIDSSIVFNRAKSIAYNESIPNYAAANPYSFLIYAPAGFYTIEASPFYLEEDGYIRGDTLRLDFKGDGPNSTILCARGAPVSVLHVDGRYVTASDFAVWGSIDEIRDTDNSPTFGINIISMRIGAIKNFRVAHIVGSGVRIDQSIINHIENGVIYRCGSNDYHAIEQTNAGMAGFQASTLNSINIEDSQGVGAFKFLSHRNTSFRDITFEQQPYHIVEISNPSGQFVRDDTLAFTSGAAGNVALSSPSAYINGNGEIVAENISGTISIGDAVTSSGGASGVVKAFTNSGGRQFFTSGEFGKFDGIFMNQNELREAGNDFSVEGDDNDFGFIRLRDLHKGVPVVISGDRNTFSNLTVSQSLTDLPQEGDFDDCVVVNGNQNIISSLRTEFAKGISLNGVRNTINKLTQRQLYGRSSDVVGDYNSILEIDSQQADYDDSLGVLENPFIRLLGVSSSVCKGLVNPLSQTTGDILQMAGVKVNFSNIEVLTTAGALNLLRSSSGGVDSYAENINCSSIGSSARGAVLVGVRSTIKGGELSGGTTSVELSANGAGCIGVTCSNYSSNGVFASNGAGQRVQNNKFHSDNSAINDINIQTSTTNSHIVDNSIFEGVGNISTGSGLGNIFRDNI